MSKFGLCVAAGAAAMAIAGSANAGIVYKFDVTTHYQFGCPGGAAGFCGSPDTSFVTVTNNGPTALNGGIADVAMSQLSGDFSQNFSLTLNPGDSFTFGTSPESSNVGGFNGPSGSPQPGIEIDIFGTVGSTPILLSVNDSEIHSGVFQTNPFGVTLDNYVLQGGDPLGRDTGDGFEVGQADGHFEFLLSSKSVPEPATWTMMIIGMFGLGAALRRRSALTA
jgi:hypothetical protein